MQAKNTPVNRPPKLLEQLRDRFRVKHYSLQTKILLSFCIKVVKIFALEIRVTTILDTANLTISINFMASRWCTLNLFAQKLSAIS
jgi:hypothetical protein